MEADSLQKRANAKMQHQTQHLVSGRRLTVCAATDDSLGLLILRPRGAR